MSKKCTVEGCDNKHYCKGYCKKHYQQFYRYGQILEKTRYDSNEIIEHDDYAEMILYNNKGEEVTRTSIDLEYIDPIKKYKWCLDGHGYVYNSKIGLLHRFIMNCPDDLVVDHINHNKLDNRVCNLRVCTQQQNNMNARKGCNNTSGVRGVSFHKTNNKWKANIQVNGKRMHLGYFKTKDEAIEARRQAEIEYFGEFSPQLQDA